MQPHQRHTEERAVCMDCDIHMTIGPCYVGKHFICCFVCFSNDWYGELKPGDPIPVVCRACLKNHLAMHELAGNRNKCQMPGDWVQEMTGENCG